MYALSILIAATKEEIALALPDWRPTRQATAQAAVRPEAPAEAGITSGTGSYVEHLESFVPSGLLGLPHATLKNITFRHLTAVCWAIGAELLQAPSPFLFPPAGEEATLHALPVEAMRKLARASDPKLKAAANKLARSAVFEEFEADQHVALALLEQLKPVAEASVSDNRGAFVLDLS